MIVGSEHHGLPDLALLDLAVAQQGIDPEVLVPVLAALGHAAGAGNALAQGAGGHIHTGHMVHVGVALQVAVNAPEGLQVLHREEAPLGQSGVQARCGVALAENEPVPVRVLGVLGVYTQFVKIKIGKEIRCGQAAAGMAALGGMGGRENVHPDLTGGDFQRLQFLRKHSITPL